MNKELSEGVWASLDPCLGTRSTFLKRTGRWEGLGDVAGRGREPGIGGTLGLPQHQV